MKKTLLLLSLASATFAHAAVVVDFDADNTTSVQAFNDSQNLTANSSSGNGTIFVAYEEVNGSQANIQATSAAGLRIRNQDSASTTVGVGAVGEAGTALFAFNLGGTYNLGTDAADEFDNFRIQTGGNADRIDTGTATRLSLQNAGTWYVSEIIHVTGTTSANALDLDWFSLPSSNFADINTISGTAVDPLTFTSITDMGAWVHLVAKEDAGGNSSSNYGVQELTFNAVPEPSTYAMLAGLCALTSVMLRRRRA